MKTVLRIASAADGGYVAGQRFYAYYPDFQGNVHVVASDGEFLQSNHYYPYGLPFAEGVAPKFQPHKYSGKEFLSDRSLNLYDFHARLQDPIIGGFDRMDPCLENSTDISAYAYCRSNPVRYVDKNGKREWPVDWEYNGGTRRHEKNFGAPRENNRTHKGLDINIGAGNDDLNAPIYATHNGVITSIKYEGDGNSGGNRVRIKSENGKIETVYMHLESHQPGLKVGSKVREGDIVGRMGNSGLRKNPVHLHYELYIDGRVTNPAIGKDNLIDPQKILDPTSVNKCYKGQDLPNIDIPGVSPPAPPLRVDFGPVKQPSPNDLTLSNS